MSIAIITGGSRGIGAATALACAERGMGVVLTFNANPGAAEKVAERIRQRGGQATAVKLDVADSASFPAFRDEVARQLEKVWNTDRFNVLVNNAGFGQFNPIVSVTEDEFDALYRVHLKGPFFLSQILLPLMADGGHIVNIGSATTRVATSGVAPYACFKGGLEVLTRYMAKEFGDRRIRANSIAPGAIRTDLGGGLNDEFEALLAGQTALGRIGEPDDVGAMIASLLGEDNRWINAQNIEVSGGYVV
ncbi:SDR family oxidoreductase [Magnetospirillum sp. 64-120]|uniref:SDR family NAD(P)-dependent oxidoreductase n=1 Tax=Magnetospirillum sp. 64-120 TaxID=1895778 RepID=UPI000929D0A3|nr:SDR family oxidoreductase [Magnetospirillum sp. 64-120]OJX79351.1 MAG: 3-oxoacyl-ACP reductase [Magnetospirillum sp. 64-120]